MTHPADRHLLTEREAAEYLATSPKTLQAWRWRGGGPPFARIGAGRGHIRYRVADLAAYVDGRLRRSTSDTGGAA